MPERHRSCKGIRDSTDAVRTEAMNVNVLATWRLAGGRLGQSRI